MFETELEADRDSSQVRRWSVELPKPTATAILVESKSTGYLLHRRSAAVHISPSPSTTSARKNAHPPDAATYPFHSCFRSTCSREILASACYFDDNHTGLLRSEDGRALLRTKRCNWKASLLGKLVECVALGILTSCSRQSNR